MLVNLGGCSWPSIDRRIGELDEVHVAASMVRHVSLVRESGRCRVVVSIAGSDQSPVSEILPEREAAALKNRIVSDVNAAVLGGK